MTAFVFYDPDTGTIFQGGQMRRAAADAAGRPYIEVENYSTDLDSKFRVENGALVPLAPEPTPPPAADA